MDKNRDVRRIRIISEEPVIASILKHRDPIIMTQEAWQWLVSWFEDIGKVVRSREFMVYNLAYLVAGLGIELTLGIIARTTKIGEVIYRLKKGELFGR